MAHTDFGVEASCFQTQGTRRLIVEALLSGEELRPEWIDFLRRTHEILTDPGTEAFQREMLAPGGDRFRLNVKDEVVGLEVCGCNSRLGTVTIAFRKTCGSWTMFKRCRRSTRAHLSQGSISARFSRFTTRYREKSSAKSSVTARGTSSKALPCHLILIAGFRFLRSFVSSVVDEGRKPILVTDWDGTMKDYCSQYATNLQVSSLIRGISLTGYNYSPSTAHWTWPGSLVHSLA